MAASQGPELVEELARLEEKEFLQVRVKKDYLLVGVALEVAQLWANY